ncbi:Arginyl-tRNA--protein transferase 1 [Podila epicladia]|nr:Arginyl-tRNA--protein transferase 1 [Podila epicladia]KAG0082138.1 Arginyl-tRNA--protein transferase 1 [Podila epicladia]
MLLSDFSVITPYGDNVSSCGYCKSSHGSRTYGMSAHLMTCKDYQKLINRGWRRSGRYLYKPNLRDSCCPQYTIRMRANEFEASKHQRQIVNRFNHFIQEGDENMEKDITARMNANQDAAMTESTSGPEPMDETPVNEKKQKPRKPPKNAPTDLRSRIHASEYMLGPEKATWKHQFRVKLEPSSFTEEKHALYVKYQMSVHNEPKSKCGTSNYTNFLVDSPLTPSVKTADWTEDNPGYGSFHQCYYLDNKLIAVSVIDILPECVSAVYFYYDPDYSILSLGKYSAQREIALVQTLNTKPGYEDLKFYYMGFYIFTCHKMTYKGQFHPSFLLDPETYNWVEFQKCKETLGEQRYSCFENPAPLDPLFEAKVQSIIRKKKGMADSDDDIDEDNDDDGWSSVDDDDEDGEEQNLDPDQFNEKALKGDLLADENVDEAKASETKGSKGTKEVSAADSEKDKKRKMDKIFKEICRLPPPGCQDATQVTADDLENVFCLSGQSTLIPITSATSYKNYKEVRKEVAEYFAMVGQDLADAMLLYLR